MFQKLTVGQKFKILTIDAQGFADMVMERNQIPTVDDPRCNVDQYMDHVATVTSAKIENRTEEWVEAEVDHPRHGKIKLLFIFFRGVTEGGTANIEKLGE